MERKKKKLRAECQLHTDGSDQDTIHRLFNKKFVYSKCSQWSLKSTSVFRQFSRKPEKEQGFVDRTNSLEAKDGMKDRLSSHQHPKDPDGNTHSEFTADSSRTVSEVIRPEEPRLMEQKSKVCGEENVCSETCENEMDLCLEQEGERSKASPVKHRHSSCGSPQSKSPHFLEGRHAQFGNANKFRRKVVSVQRQLKKVRVDLPPPWQCDTLITVKNELNALKDKLSDKEMIAWHQHTTSTNMAGKIVGEIKNRYNAELCTQAWCKFHEILASYDVVPPSVLSRPEARLNSIHLCEAPGAFITSLNHYLVSRGFDTQKWSWVGTTLNPYYEGNDTGHMISDDRFIRTTLRSWFFGRDNSGDLMSEDNMLALMERGKLMGDVLLVTADGSIDCQENPAEQEMIVSRLHHCEVLSSCLLLAPGGTLVIKLFTMLEASSIALLYFLNCAFEKVTVCKPATSKAGNSEVYAVCSGYAAPLPHDALFSVFSAVCSSEDPHIVLLPREDIPEDFLAEHIKCCLYFCKLQSDTISQNLALYGKMKEAEKRRMLRLQDLCLEHYISICVIQDIDDEDRIRPFGYKSNYSRFANSRSKSDNRWSNKTTGFIDPNLSGFGSSAVSVPLGRLQGTFQQRQQQNQFSWRQLLAQMQDYSVDESCVTIKCRQSPTEEEVKEWRVKMGRKFNSVASSHFCDSRLLGDLHLVLQHAQVKFHQQKAVAQYSTTILIEALHFLHTASQKNYYATSASGVFHLALEDSITSFWPPESRELSAFTIHRLGCVEDLQQLEGEGPVGVVVDVTCPRWLGEEEVRCQTRLLDVVLNVCSYLQSGSTLVLIMPVALTRLSAGLLYIFSTLFQETSFVAKGESIFLHQTLCFFNLSYPHYILLRLLETLRQAFLSAQHHTPICRNLSLAETDHDPDSCLPVDGSSERRRAGYSSSVLCHGSVDSVASDGHEKCVSDDCGRCMSCDSSGLSYHHGSDSVACDDTGKCHSRHNTGSADILVLCGADRTRDVSSGKVVENVSSGNTDADRQISHDGDKVTCQTPVKCVAHGDGDRHMSHDGDKATSHKDVDSVINSDNSDRRMSHDGDKMPCHKCTLSQSSDTSDSVSASQKIRDSCNNDSNSESSNFQRSVLKVCIDSGGRDNVAKPGNHRTGARGGTEAHHKGSITSHHVKSSEGFVSHDGAGCGSIASSGLCTKRIRVSCDNSEPPVTAAGRNHLSAVSQSRQHGKNAIFQIDSVDAATSGVGESSEGKVMAEVPLEVVPVLEMINDVTFTRFLQASNRQSVSSFLATVKAAEQRLLSQSTPT